MCLTEKRYDLVFVISLLVLIVIGFSSVTDVSLTGAVIGVQLVGETDDIEPFYDDFSFGLGNTTRWTNTTSNGNISVVAEQIQFNSTANSNAVDMYVITPGNVSLNSFNITANVTVENISNTMVTANSFVVGTILLSTQSFDAMTKCGLMVENTGLYSLYFSNGTGPTAITTSSLEGTGNNLTALIKLNYDNVTTEFNCSVNIQGQSVSLLRTSGNFDHTFGVGMGGNMAVFGPGDPEGDMNVTFYDFNFSEVIEAAALPNGKPAYAAASIVPASPEATDNLNVNYTVLDDGTNAEWSEVVFNWFNDKSGAEKSDTFVNLVFYNATGVLQDLSGNGYDGYITGSPRFDVNPAFNGSLNFSNSGSGDHYVNISSFNSVNFSEMSTGFTMAVSFDVSDDINTSTDVPLLTRNYGFGDEFAIRISGSGGDNGTMVSWISTTGENIDFFTNGVLDFTVPHRVYFVYNSSNNFTVYFDGIKNNSQVINTTNQMMSNGGELLFGAFAAVTGDPGDVNFTGDIQYFRMWNRSMTDAEVALMALNSLNNSQIHSAATALTEQWRASGYTYNSLGLFNSTAFNSSSVTISVPGIDCGQITTNSNLTGNITSTDTCITFGASNIILNCDNYGIIFNSNGGDNEYGIDLNSTSNNTIKNCIIEDTSGGGFGTSIIYSSYGSFNTTIFNNTIREINSNGAPLVYLTHSNQTNVSNNNINSSAGGNLVSLDNSSNNFITGNLIYTTGSESYGISLWFSNATIYGNNITTTQADSSGIDINGKQNGDLRTDLTAGTIIDTNSITTSGSTSLIVLGSEKITIKNNNITSSGAGFTGSLSLDLVNDSTIENNDFQHSTGAVGAIFLFNSSNNNIFLNNNISAGTKKSINDQTSTTTINHLIYNNTWGEIRWIDNGTGSFVRNLTLTGAIGLNRNLSIGNNSASLNTSAFSDSAINGSANITLKGLDLSNSNQIIKYNTYSTNSSHILGNGSDCSSTSCSLVSYSGGLLIFNTTSFSSFSGQAAVACGTITTDTTLTENLSNTATCFTVTASGITIDGAGYTISGAHSGAGILIQANNTIIKNISIYDFASGINIQTLTNNHSVSNVTIINSSDDALLVQQSVNNTFTNLNISAIADSANDGTILIQGGTYNNTFYGLTIEQAPVEGIRLRNANLTIIRNSRISHSKIGLKLFEESNLTTLVNFTIIPNASSQFAIQDDTPDNYISYISYNTSWGEIKWIDNGTGSFLRNLTLNGSIGPSTNLFIGNNTAALNSSAFTIGKINSSANITLTGISNGNIINIRRLNNYTIDSSIINSSGILCDGLSCNLISYSSGTLIFNTTSFSSFTGTESVGCKILTTSVNLTENLTSTSTCFTISGSNVRVDGKGYSIIGAASGAAFAVQGNNSIITNLTIYDFATGIDLMINSHNSTLSNLTIINVSDDSLLIQTSHNNTINNLNISAVADSSNDGTILVQTGSYNTTFKDLTIEQAPIESIRIRSSNLTTISGGRISNPNIGIHLMETASNNTFFNLTIIPNSTTQFTIQDDTNDTMINYLIYNTSFGEIKWIDNGTGSFLRNLTLNGSIGPSTNLFIGNNTAALNSSAFTIGKINSSANITLDGISLPTINNIRRLNNYTLDSSIINSSGTLCNGTSCEVLSYSSGTLVFNTTSFSSFTGTESSFCTTISSDTNLLNNLTISTDCLTFDTVDTTFDGKGFSLIGSNTGSALLIQANGTIIKNLTIYGFQRGIDIQDFHNNRIENVTFINVSDDSIYVANSSNNTFQSLTISTIVDASSDGTILLKSGSTNNIFNNILIQKAPSIGYQINNSNQTTVQNNNLSHSSIFIQLSGNSNNNTFLNNNITLNSTTQFTIKDNTSLAYNNTLIYNNSFGEITWNSSNLTTNITLQVNNTIFLSDNLVGLINDNQSMLLNNTAQIKFFGLSLTTPQLLRDGTRCDNDDTCNTSYSSPILTAIVSHFSNYSTQETPAAAAAAAASSGGGGGSSSSTTATPAPAQPTPPAPTPTPTKAPEPAPKKSSGSSSDTTQATEQVEKPATKRKNLSGAAIFTNLGKKTSELFQQLANSKAAKTTLISLLSLAVLSVGTRATYVTIKNKMTRNTTFVHSPTLDFEPDNVPEISKWRAQNDLPLQEEFDIINKNLAHLKQESQKIPQHAQLHGHYQKATRQIERELNRVSRLQQSEKIEFKGSKEHSILRTELSKIEEQIANVNNYKAKNGKVINNIPERQGHSPYNSTRLESEMGHVSERLKRHGVFNTTDLSQEKLDYEAEMEALRRMEQSEKSSKGKIRRGISTVINSISKKPGYSPDDSIQLNQELEHVSERLKRHGVFNTTSPSQEKLEYEAEMEALRRMEAAEKSPKKKKSKKR